MRSRKVKDIDKVLRKKGFEKISHKKKKHHSYYYLYAKGKKTHIFTYLSHGAKGGDYSKELMSRVSQQLKFKENKLAEDFLDCPMGESQYLSMLDDLGEL